MDSTRLARLASLIQEELSVFINREVKDPRIPSVTLTRVDLTPDAGLATVYFTILGSIGEETPEKNKEAKECQVGLNSASGYIRRHLAKVLTLRSVPSLVFKEDKGLSNSIRVHELLKQINKGEGESGSSER